MKRCLSCNLEGERRVKGKCPNCGVSVRIYKEYFVPVDKPFPAVTVLREFVRIVRQRDELPTFSISKKNPNYFSEIRAAISLLELCGWDCDLALASLKEALYHRNIAWKKYTSLRLLVNSTDISTGISMVQKRRREREIRENKKQSIIDDLMSKEDIFKR